MAISDAHTEKIIGCGIAIHRARGPGLLESAYEECIALEFREAGLSFRRQVPLPVVYKAIRLEQGYRNDFFLEETVVLEIKSPERLLPIHEAQLLIYLRLSGIRTGLLINFGAAILREGIRRMSLREAPEFSSPPPRLPAKLSNDDAQEN
jgi:GxxExxY protein